MERPFIDRATIEVRAGDGGDGCVSFRREKFVPRGGPDGGDGGRGGDVVLVVNPQMETLLDFQYQGRFRAEDGGHGRGKNQTGADGKMLRVEVPPGTVVRDAETGEVLADLTGEVTEVLVARGGRGGRGNAQFATATHQAPRRAERGQAGEERRIELLLKLIADVGLIGKPNAGKSTLLSRISAARPKIGDYPFTTLHPHLGVVDLGDTRFVVADVPGLIEGAHEGKGLGLEFLRHLERTRLLVYLIEVTASDAMTDYKTLRSEVAAYSDILAARSHAVVLTKADLLPSGEAAPAVEAPGAFYVGVISAVRGEGLKGLLGALAEALARVQAAVGLRDE